MKQHDIVLWLRQIPIFSELDTTELVELGALTREQGQPPNSVIVKEGEFESGLYIIVEGQVKITRGDIVVSELGPKQFFGEVALFEGGVRKTTAVTNTGAQLLKLERRELLQLMEEEPAIAIRFCKALSRKIRIQNERLHELESPDMKHKHRTVELLRPETYKETDPGVDNKDD